MEETLRHSGTPIYAFIGGMMYAAGERYAHTDTAARPGLGDGYGRVRIADEVVAGLRWRSLLYLKAPVVVVQSAHDAVLWELAPAAQPVQPFAGMRCTATETVITIRHLSHCRRTKHKTHFGAWREEPVVPLAAGSQLPTYQRYAGTGWCTLMRDYARRLMASAPGTVSGETWDDAVRQAGGYLRRCRDPRTGVHAEFMRRHTAHHVGGSSLFCLIAYELERADTLDRQGDTAAARAAWQAIIMADTASVVLPELGGARLWHNTAGRQQGQLWFHTEYASGMAGYPGGQANLLAAALRVWSRHRDWPGEGRLRAGCEWLLRTQLSDGGWALAYPTVPAEEPDNQRQATAARAATGATAAAARALLTASAVWDEPGWRVAALRGLQAVNPQAPHYAFAGSGFLRDAGENEQDGVSGAELLQANLLAWQQTRAACWRDTAVALGCYLIGWQRGWGRKGGYGLVDPMVSSFAPRLALWDTMLWAEAYLALADATGDNFWQELGAWTAAHVLPYRDRLSGGWSESWALDAAGAAHPFYLENGVTVWMLRLADQLGVKPAAAAALAKSMPPAMTPSVAARVAIPVTPALRGAARAVVPAPVRRLLRRWRPVPPDDDETVPDLADVPADMHPATAIGWKLSVHTTNGWCATLVPPDESNVTRVHFPVLRWSQPVRAAAVTQRLGQAISECRVVIGDRPWRLRFGTPVDMLWRYRGTLVCETTLRALWSLGAPLTMTLEMRADD